LEIDNSDLNPSKLINRKQFLRLIALAAGSAFVIIWNSMARKQRQLSETPVITKIDVAKLGTGIFFFAHFILSKSENSIKVFSNKCTHAGCRINQEIDGQLICPCHGSKFDASTGRVLQDPAGLPLSIIPFAIDEKTAEIIVKI
jgi:Rieske Fe-S protein